MWASMEARSLSFSCSSSLFSPRTSHCFRISRKCPLRVCVRKRRSIPCVFSKPASPGNSSSSPDFGLVSTTECSDGSLVFRFGDVREVERVDVETEELEGTGDDDVDQVASATFSNEDGKTVYLREDLHIDHKKEVADSNFNRTAKEKAESHSVAEFGGDSPELIDEIILNRGDYSGMAEVVSVESPQSMMETIERDSPTSIGFSKLSDAVSMETISISENNHDASVTTDSKSHPTEDMATVSDVEEVLEMKTVDEDIAPASLKADLIVEVSSDSPSEESIQENVQTDGSTFPDTAAAMEKVDMSIKGSSGEDSAQIEIMLASPSLEVESLMNENIGNVATSIAPDGRKSESLQGEDDSMLLNHDESLELNLHNIELGEMPAISGEEQESAKSSDEREEISMTEFCLYSGAASLPHPSKVERILISSPIRDG